MMIPAAGYEAYLMPESNTKFVSVDGSSEASFDIADDGTVSGMTVQAFGYTLPATKDK
jgi:hypothetical protein